MNRFNKQEDESQWLPISDLMSVLMMVFIIISVFYMLQVVKDKKRIEEIAITYNKLQNNLFKDLNTEFSSDLSNWNAEIDSVNLSVKFIAPNQLKTNTPKIFFKTGSSKIELYGKDVLKDFFPRFLKIIYSEKHKNDIEEVRIEGHTSSDWEGTNPNYAYIRNMKLSQDRTRNVLEYVLGITTNVKKRKWLQSNLTSNGLSSSKIILNLDNSENKNASRRVEFRVKTNAENSLIKILKD